MSLARRSGVPATEPLVEAHSQLQLYRSDGDPSKWPESVIPANLANVKNYNFFEAITVNTEDPAFTKKLRLYLDGIGKYLAEKWGRAEFQGHVLKLVDLPEGYRLFMHRTRKNGDPERVDGYIYGHPTGSKFRSLNEAKDHFAALAGDVDKEGNVASYYAIINSGSPLHKLESLHSTKLQDHVCKPCASLTRERSSNTPRGPRAAGKVTNNKAIAVKANRHVTASEAKQAMEYHAFMHRMGEVVWAATGQKIEDANGRLMWFAALVVEVPEPLDWQQFVNEDPAVGIYTLRIFSDKKDQESIRIHSSMIVPYVFRPRVDQIVKQSELYAQKAVSSFTPFLESTNVFTDATHTNAATIPDKDLQFVEIKGMVMQVVAAYIGPHKIFVHEVFQMADKELALDPLDPKTYTLMATKAFMMVHDDEWENPDGTKGRKVKLQMLGDIYDTPATDLPADEATRDRQPAYIRKPKDKLVDLDWQCLDINDDGFLRLQLARHTDIQTRYYEPDACRYWLTKHNVTFRPIEINKIAQSRQEVLPWDQIGELKLREVPRVRTPAPSPSRAFQAINTAVNSATKGLFSPAEKEKIARNGKTVDLTKNAPLAVDVVDHEGDSIMGDDSQFSEDD